VPIQPKEAAQNVIGITMIIDYEYGCHAGILASISSASMARDPRQAIFLIDPIESKEL